MTDETRARIAAWRALSPAEKTLRRRALVVDQVVASMSMEGQPVSAEWERQARQRRAALSITS